MAENKSIDGLSTHADKKAKSTPKKSKKTVKTVSPEDFASTPDSNIWDSIIENNEPEKKEIDLIEEIDNEPEPETPKKPAKKPKQVDGFTPIKKEEKPLNFLKPVAAYDFNEEEGLTESDDTVEEMKNLGLGEAEIEEKEEEKEEEPEMTEKEAKKKARLEAKKAKKDAKKNGKKKPSKKRKIITITALVIVLLMIGVVVWAIFWGNDIIAKITGGRGNIFDFLVESYEPLKTDENGRTNILAIGTGGYNMDGDEGNGVHDGAQLTDSIMLISFDQKTGDVAMISLPRDL